MMRTKMPAVAVFKHCPLHAYQSSERIENVVVPEIETVYALHAAAATAALLDWAADGQRAPESRLLAARLLLEPASTAAAARQKVTIDRAFVQAATIGLDELESAQHSYYGAMFHPPAPPGVRFPARPAEHADGLRKAQARVRASAA